MKITVDILSVSCKRERERERGGLLLRASLKRIGVSGNRITHVIYNG